MEGDESGGGLVQIQFQDFTVLKIESGSRSQSSWGKSLLTSHALHGGEKSKSHLFIANLVSPCCSLHVAVR